MSKNQKVSVVIGAIALLALAVYWTARLALRPHYAGVICVVRQVDPLRPEDWPADSAKRNSILRSLQRAILDRTGALGAGTQVEIMQPDKLVMRVGVAKPKEVLSHIKVGETETLEVFMLNVAQPGSRPNGKWRMEQHSDEMGRSYTFVGPKGERIDSLRQPAEVIRNVAKAPALLTGTDFRPTAVARVADAGTVVVEVQMTEKGAATLGRVVNSRSNVCLGLFYNGGLIMAPTVSKLADYSHVEINGFSHLGQAEDVANYINAGALPVRLRTVSARIESSR